MWIWYFYVLPGTAEAAVKRGGRRGVDRQNVSAIRVVVLTSSVGCILGLKVPKRLLLIWVVTCRAVRADLVRGSEKFAYVGAVGSFAYLESASLRLGEHCWTSQQWHPGVSRSDRSGRRLRAAATSHSGDPGQRN